MKKKTAPSAKSASSKTSRAAPPAPIEVSVDYPLEGEQVLLGHYAVRATAPAASEVEICINERLWEPCRESLGHYWLDWYPDAPGEHRIAARARVGKGRWAKSEVRNCLIVE